MEVTSGEWDSAGPIAGEEVDVREVTRMKRRVAMLYTMHEMFSGHEERVAAQHPVCHDCHQEWHLNMHWANSR